MIPSEILDYYHDGSEEHRLARSLGRLERIRTLEIMERLLPPPAKLLDIGGGTGVYAIPLARRGYRVHLVDAVPLHIERALALSEASKTPQSGMRESLACRTQRLTRRYCSVRCITCLTGAIGLMRSLKHGGFSFRVGCSFQRTSPGLPRRATASRRAVCEMRRLPRSSSVITDGVHQNPKGRSEWFTTAYFYRPDEIRPEIDAAGLRFEDLIAVEGPGWMSHDLDAWLDDAIARERLLQVLRRTETEPSMLGSSAHLISSARKHRAGRITPKSSAVVAEEHNLIGSP